MSLELTATTFPLLLYNISQLAKLKAIYSNSTKKTNLATKGIRS